MELRIFPRDGAEVRRRRPAIRTSWPEFLNHKNGGAYRSIPVCAFYTRDLEYLYHFTEYAAIYDKDRVVVQNIRAPKPGESPDQTRARADREFGELQRSPFWRIWASAAVDEIISALHRKARAGRRLAKLSGGRLAARRAAPGKLADEALLAARHRPAVVGAEDRLKNRRKPAQERFVGPNPPVVHDVDDVAILPKCPDAAPYEVAPRLDGVAEGRLRDSATRNDQRSVYGSRPRVWSATTLPMPRSSPGSSTLTPT